MFEFTVWAPLVERIAVVVGEKRFPMGRMGNRGWWTARIEEAGPGTDYAFLLDDDPKPYPDPRSLWQPHGVHGVSRLYDHAAFRWSDSGWQAPPLSSAILYELHIGTFSPEGTFDGAIRRLDHLVRLGVTHVELMPVAEFPGGFGWGYDGVSLFAVKQSYGGPDGLKRFVDACHAKGLAVVLDVVYNHFGPEGNYSGRFAPYRTDRHHTPWGEAVNLEFEASDEVRRFFCDNALMWLRDYYVDGLRLDAVHEFVDRSAIHFLEQLSTEVEALSQSPGRRLVLIAESDLNDPRVVTPRQLNGYGFDAQWNDDFHHALFTVLHSPEREQGYYADFGSMEKLAKSLAEVFVNDGVYSKYRRRIHGRPVGDLPRHRFVGFLQNHDQVGNRARGERVEHLVGLERAKVGMGLALLSPFIPLLFQGEEFAASSPFQFFAHFEEPELARAVADGRRREFAAFGWTEVPDPGSQETFERSKLRWDETGQASHAEMLAWCRSLIALRKRSFKGPAQLRVSFDEQKQWLAMERAGVSVLLNLGRDAVEFCKPDGYVLALASSNDVRVETARVYLPPDRIAVLSGERKHPDD
ncbi:MAG: malto-oligosyltrehalose trehalohydrolase [Acidobacteriaceae bacterium]|nr:malto-oligosyltrehalose trehalohydrolase [Acidobacteriaceae bacterium]